MHPYVKDLQTNCNSILALKRQIYLNKIKMIFSNGNDSDLIAKNKAKKQKIKLLSQNNKDAQYFKFYKEKCNKLPAFFENLGENHIILPKNFIDEHLKDIMERATGYLWTKYKLDTIYSYAHLHRFVNHAIVCLIKEKTELPVKLTQTEIIRLVQNKQMILMDDQWENQLYIKSDLPDYTPRIVVEKYIQENNIQPESNYLIPYLFHNKILTNIDDFYAKQYPTLRSAIWEAADKKLKSDTQESDLLVPLEQK